MTPGAVDPAVTLADICNGTTRVRRSVSHASRACALRNYNMPDGRGVEIDHLVPLELGGANTCANLWPQPWAEAVLKDRCEDSLRAVICHGSPPMALARAQRAIAEDWVSACRAY